VDERPVKWRQLIAELASHIGNNSGNRSIGNVPADV
jgi:hypothetical protein